LEELRAVGSEGGCDAVRRYAKIWSREHSSQSATAHVSLSFAPGEGLPVRLESRDRRDERRDNDLEGRARPPLPQPHDVRTRLSARDPGNGVRCARSAFAFFKGACTRGIYDNMKTAVDTIFVGKDRQYNRRFLQMCSHHLVDPVACTPA
jgi:hypothetical protein